MPNVESLAVQKASSHLEQQLRAQRNNEKLNVGVYDKLQAYNLADVSQKLSDDISNLNNSGTSLGLMKDVVKNGLTIIENARVMVAGTSGTNIEVVNKVVEILKSATDSVRNAKGVGNNVLYRPDSSGTYKLEGLKIDQSSHRRSDYASILPNQFFRSKVNHELTNSLIKKVETEFNDDAKISNLGAWIAVEDFKSDVKNGADIIAKLIDQLATFPEADQTFFQLIANASTETKEAIWDTVTTQGIPQYNEKDVTKEEFLKSTNEKFFAVAMRLKDQKILKSPLNVANDGFVGTNDEGKVAFSYIMEQILGINSLEPALATASYADVKSFYNGRFSDAIKNAKTSFNFQEADEKLLKSHFDQALDALEERTSTLRVFTNLNDGTFQATLYIEFLSRATSKTATTSTLFNFLLAEARASNANAAAIALQIKDKKPINDVTFEPLLTGVDLTNFYNFVAAMSNGATLKVIEPTIFINLDPTNPAFSAAKIDLNQLETAYKAAINLTFQKTYEVDLDINWATDTVKKSRMEQLFKDTTADGIKDLNLDLGNLADSTIMLSFIDSVKANLSKLEIDLESTQENITRVIDSNRSHIVSLDNAVKELRQAPPVEITVGVTDAFRDVSQALTALSTEASRTRMEDETLKNILEKQIR